MPADSRVDGTDVEAGAAANAVQRLPSHCIGEHARPAVVEQHDVELLRPVVGRHAGPQRGVRIHALAGRGARQELQEDLEVGERRHELLDPEHAHEHGRQRRAHAPVALRLDDHDRARLGDAEVGAADADARVEELLSQVEARRLGELARVVGERAAGGDRAQEEIADLGAVSMDRRDEDMRGPVTVELQDQLGEIGLDRLDAAGRERVVQADLVGRQ